MSQILIIQLYDKLHDLGTKSILFHLFGASFWDIKNIAHALLFPRLVTRVSVIEYRSLPFWFIIKYPIFLQNFKLTKSLCYSSLQSVNCVFLLLDTFSSGSVTKFIWLLIPSLFPIKFSFDPDYSSFMTSSTSAVSVSDSVLFSTYSISTPSLFLYSSAIQLWCVTCYDWFVFILTQFPNPRVCEN